MAFSWNVKKPQGGETMTAITAMLAQDLQTSMAVTDFTASSNTLSSPVLWHGLSMPGTSMRPFETSPQVYKNCQLCGAPRKSIDCEYCGVRS